MHSAPASYSVNGKEFTRYYISYEARFSDFCASYFPGDS